MGSFSLHLTVLYYSTTVSSFRKWRVQSYTFTLLNTYNIGTYRITKKNTPQCKSSRIESNKPSTGLKRTVLAEHRYFFLQHYFRAQNGEHKTFSCHDLWQSSSLVKMPPITDRLYLVRLISSHLEYLWKPIWVREASNDHISKSKVDWAEHERLSAPHLLLRSTWDHFSLWASNIKFYLYTYIFKNEQDASRFPSSLYGNLKIKIFR